MALRIRGGIWHFRFKLDGRTYAETTGLDATEPDEIKAENIKEDAARIEQKFRDALLEGRSPTRRIKVRKFKDAVADFFIWGEAHYRAHPSSFKRIQGSFASLLLYFALEPVSLIDAGKIERYKTWRVNEYGVRDVTLRHDLHALSKFYGYAILQHWTNNNPVREIEIPSDADAERMHILTASEEEEYFKRAAKSPNLYDIGRLMINQGVRPEEAAALAKVDVNLKRRQVLIRKSKSAASERTLDLTTESCKILASRMKGTSPWIFPSDRKSGCHIGRINSAHDALVAQAEKEGVIINWVPYDFRHTFATRIALGGREGGVDLVTLAALLGHDGIRVVKKYVHPTAEHKKAAMAKYERLIKELKNPPEKGKARR
jgi:integrase